MYYLLCIIYYVLFVYIIQCTLRLQQARHQVVPKYTLALLLIIAVVSTAVLCVTQYCLLKWLKMNYVFKNELGGQK